MTHNRQKLQGRHKEDTRKTQGRHKEDTRKTQGRHKEDTRKTQRRHKEDTRKTQGRHKEDTRKTRGRHKEDTRKTQGRHKEDTRKKKYCLSEAFHTPSPKTVFRQPRNTLTFTSFVKKRGVKKLAPEGGALDREHPVGTPLVI